MRPPLFQIALAVFFSIAALTHDDCPCWTPSARQIAAFEPKIADRLLIEMIAPAAILSPADLAQDHCPCWTPSARQIAAVEAKIADRPLPLGGLDRYVRYYAGVSDKSRYILGKLIPESPNDLPGVHIVERRILPRRSEGCLFRSDPAGERWLNLTCAPPGAWTPSDEQIAELEGLIQLQFPELSQGRQRSGRLPERKLQRYARHYAGVTEGDRRIIVGLIVAASDKTAGIYIENRAEFPAIMDGGCGVINVRYDTSSTQFRLDCNGRA